VEDLDAEVEDPVDEEPITLVLEAQQHQRWSFARFDPRENARFVLTNFPVSCRHFFSSYWLTYLPRYFEGITQKFSRSFLKCFQI